LKRSAIAAEPWEKYRRLMKQAQKEILMMISSQGVIDLARDVKQLKEWNRRGVSVKILAPLTNENSEAVNLLSECCEIKHAPTSYLDSTIVDGSYLFQFKNLSIDSEIIPYPLVQGAFYSTDKEHIGKTRQLFNELWKIAQSPSSTWLQSTNSPPPSEDTLTSAARASKGG
jgi:hypothetical protein